MSEQDQNVEVLNRFIALANTIKEEGVPIHVVSWGLMNASAVYSTYSVAGNTGGLNPSGVDKVVDTFRDCMNHVQDARKEELRDQGAEIQNEQA